MGRVKNAERLDAAYCELHNTGAYLVGNTQASDLDWLAHLRGPGPYTRGCWVLDLLTGRS